MTSEQTRRIDIAHAAGSTVSAVIEQLTFGDRIEFDVPTPRMLEPHSTMDIASDLLDALIAAQEIGPTTGSIGWKRIPGGYGTAAIRFYFEVVDVEAAARALVHVAQGVTAEDPDSETSLQFEELRARCSSDVYGTVRFCADLADDYLANAIIGAAEDADEEFLKEWYTTNPSYRLHCWRSVQAALAKFEVYLTPDGCLLPPSTPLLETLRVLGEDEITFPRPPTETEWNDAQAVLAHLDECASTISWAVKPTQRSLPLSRESAKMSADGRVLAVGDHRAQYVVFV